MKVRVVAIGDSFTCGEGVGLRISAEQTWISLLVSHWTDADLINLSRPGARVRDASREQAGPARAVRADLATVLIGLNDVIRSGLDRNRLARDLAGLVVPLLADGTTVLLARLHHPGRVLRLPEQLRRSLADRVALLNAAVDEVAAAHAQVHVLDLESVAALRHPGAWAVDGIHPSPAGHRVLAYAAARALYGVPIGPAAQYAPPPEAFADLSMPPGVSARDRIIWLASYGTPWLVQHFGRVAPAVLSMMMRSERSAATDVDRVLADAGAGSVVGVVGAAR